MKLSDHLFTRIGFSQVETVVPVVVAKLLRVRLP